MFDIFDSAFDKITGKNNLVRITGLFAILGTLMILITDYKILYMPLSVREYSTFRAAMSHSRSDILFYTTMAIIATAIVLVGLYHLYITLSIANRLAARVTVAAYAFGYINAAFYYAYLAYVMITAQLIVPVKLSLPYLTKHIYHLFQLQYYGGIIAGSIFFFISIGFFKGKNYPKWYIYINPIYLIMLFRMILPMGTPPVVSGFFLTSTFNFIMLITFSFSTIIMWNKSMQELIPDTAK